MIEDWQYELRAGSEKTLKNVFCEYYSLLSSVAYQYVGDKQISEGIAEDVIVHLWEKREQILPLENFRRYILIMVRNRSLDYLKMEKNHISVENSNARCFIADNDIFEDLIRDELQQIIDNTLNSLSPQCRLVFEMSRDQGMTYHEIALELGISDDMVKYQIKRALKAFRKAFSQYMVMLVVVMSVRNSF